MAKSRSSLVLLLLCVSAPALAQYCRVNFSMANRNRWVTSDSIHAECGPFIPPFFPHTPPFGNWGANSIWGYLNDGNQFTGWKGAGSDPNPEWNSCTDTYPWGPDQSSLGAYYNVDLNSNGLGDAQYSGGSYIYSGASVEIWTDCPRDTDWNGLCDAGGCVEMLDYPFGFGGEFLELYELDSWPWPDTYVGTLVVNASGCEVQFENCGFGGCYSTEYGPWCPTYPSDLGSAEVQMILWWAEFIDEYDPYLQTTYCQELASWNREYDCEW